MSRLDIFVFSIYLSCSLLMSTTSSNATLVPSLNTIVRSTSSTQFTLRHI